MGCIRDKLPNRGDVMHTCLGLAGTSQFLNKIGQNNAEIPEYKSEININKQNYMKFIKLIKMNNVEDAVQELNRIEELELKEMINTTIGDV